jgi:Uma2 family endonuclease
MRAIADQKYTLDEYFELEKRSEEKWEFWNGNVWNMSGASLAHEDIVSNTLRALGNRLPQGCRVSGSNVRVRVPSYLPYRYPDLTVVCGKRDQEIIGGLELLINPQLIVEVLSPSTEAFDRGDKFTYYKSIPSLNEYLLIATAHSHVTHFVKQSESEWINRDILGIKGMISLPTFGVELSLEEIYLDVIFPERPIDPSPDGRRIE